MPTFKLTRDQRNPIRIFISHARADDHLRSELEERLAPLAREAKLDVYHDDKILPGDERRAASTAALEASDVILLLVSPSFLASEDCAAEMRRALTLHKEGKARATPILVRPASYEEALASSGLLVIPTNGKAVTRWDDRDEAWVHVVRDILSAVEGGKAASFGRGALPALHILPKVPDTIFVGRERELQAIERRLWTEDEAPVVVIYGLPGVGKTRLAVEYAKRNGGRYPGGVLFLNCKRMPPEELDDAFDHLKLPPKEGEIPERRARRVLDAMGRQPTLLIYDDVRSQEDLAAWLPSMGRSFHILVTSTSLQWPSNYASELLGCLSDAEAEAYIRGDLGDEVAAELSPAILERTGGLIIELSHVTRFIREALRRGQKAEILKELSSATRASFDGPWSQLGKDARLLLRVASLFENDRISEDELWVLLRAERWLSSRFDRALNEALDRCLLGGEPGRRRMHQCIAAFVRGQPSPELSNSLCELHARRFVKAAEAYREAPSSREARARFFSYPAEPDAWQSLPPGVVKKLRDHARDVGTALRLGGRFAEALAWFEYAVAEALKGDAFGFVDNVEVADALLGAGLCNVWSYRYEQAFACLEKASENFLKYDPKERMIHKALGACYAFMGRCCRVQGSAREPVRWLRRSIAEYKKSALKGEPAFHHLGVSFFELGVCFKADKQFRKARCCFMAAVQALKKGDREGRVSYRDIALNITDIGDCFYGLNQFEEALLWYRRAVEEQEPKDTFGRLDYNVLGNGFKGLGASCLELGRFEDALAWSERAVIEIQKGDIYEHLHEDHLAAAVNLVGTCNMRLKRCEDALPCLLRAVDLWQKGDGNGKIDYQNLDISLRRLGKCYLSLNDPEKALPVLERALVEIEKAERLGQVDQKSVALTKSALEEARQALRERM